MLDAAQAAVIKGMLARGDHQHDIAAHFGINGGRVAEIKANEKFSDVKAASVSSLPAIDKARRFIDPNAPLSKQIDVFKELINKSPENSRIITFTPELATWILENLNRTGNRKRKPERIQRYAKAMSQGDWVLTGETIIFAKTGALLDGQNRLSGCVRAGKKFRTHVVFGIEDDAFITMNSGKARTPGDLFFTAGIADSALVSGAVRWLMIYDKGNPLARSSFSNQEMWDYYNTSIDSAEISACVAVAKKVNKIVPKAALAAHFYMFSHKHGRTAMKFMGDFIANQRGARKLITMLNKVKTNQTRLSDTWINAILVQTWNAYRADELVTAKHFKWNDAKEYPVIA